MIKTPIETKGVPAIPYLDMDKSIYDENEVVLECGLCLDIDERMSKGESIEGLVVNGWKAVLLRDGHNSFLNLELNSKDEYQETKLSKMFHDLNLDDLRYSKWCRVCGSLKLIDTYIKVNHDFLDCSFTLYEEDRDVKKVTIAVNSPVLKVKLENLNARLFIDEDSTISIPLVMQDYNNYKIEMNKKLIANVKFNRLNDNNSIDLIEIVFAKDYEFDFINPTTFTIQINLKDIENLVVLENFDVVTTTSFCENNGKLKPHRFYKGCFKK